MFSTEEIGQKYDGFAKWYDLLELPRELFVGANLRRQLFSNACRRVLEVGVGTGKNFKYYPKDCEITAIDISEGMLEKAEERARKLGRDISFKIMDAENLRFPDNSFDSVVDSGSLCTYVEPIKVLKEMSKVCKPNGRILLLEHGRSSYEWLGRWQDGKTDKHARRVGCYWNREPLELVKESGLEVVEVRRTFFGTIHSIEALPFD